jgi:hypothetical protein
LWQDALVTNCFAFSEAMLDAGFCLPTIASRSGEAGGDAGYLKVIIFFYPASSIQDPVSETIWDKPSFPKICLFW